MGSLRDDGIGEPRRALVHVAQRAGVRHQRLDGGIERGGTSSSADAARGQHATQQLRQAVALADGDGRLGCGRLEPLAPGEAAHGCRDAQIGAALLRRPA